MAELTEQQELFLDVFFTQARVMDYHKAANAAKAAAGYSDKTPASVIMRQDRMAEAIVKRATQELALTLPKTLFKVEGVLDDPTQPGAKSVLDAAVILMDRAGLVKRDKTEIEVKAPDGVILIPSKKVLEEPQN